MVRNMAIATMTRGPNFNAITELLRETPGLPTSMDFEELARRLINTVRITGSARYGRGAVLTPVYSLSMSTTLMNAVTFNTLNMPSYMAMRVTDFDFFFRCVFL